MASAPILNLIIRKGIRFCVAVERVSDTALFKITHCHSKNLSSV